MQLWKMRRVASAAVTVTGIDTDCHSHRCHWDRLHELFQNLVEALLESENVGFKWHCK